jgi:hypothetical protein
MERGPSPLVLGIPIRGSTWSHTHTPISPRMEKVKAGKDSSDDTCSICTNGDELLCCDSCMSTFYLECLAIKVLEGS